MKAKLIERNLRHTLRWVADCRGRLNLLGRRLYRYGILNRPLPRVKAYHGLTGDELMRILGIGKYSPYKDLTRN